MDECFFHSTGESLKSRGELLQSWRNNKTPPGYFIFRLRLQKAFEFAQLFSNDILRSQWQAINS